MAFESTVTLSHLTTIEGLVDGAAISSVPATVGGVAGTQSTAGSRPTFTASLFNGRGGFAGDTGKFLEFSGASLQPAGAFSLLWIVSVRPKTGFCCPFHMGASESDNNLLFISIDHSFCRYSGTVQASSKWPQLINRPAVYGYSWDGRGTETIWFNGAPIQTNVVTAPTTNSKIYLGSSTWPHSGDIFGYASRTDRALSAAEMKTFAAEALAYVGEDMETRPWVWQMWNSLGTGTSSATPNITTLATMGDNLPGGQSAWNLVQFAESALGAAVNSSNSVWSRAQALSKFLATYPRIAPRTAAVVTEWQNDGAGGSLTATYSRLKAAMMAIKSSDAIVMAEYPLPCNRYTWAVASAMQANMLADNNGAYWDYLSTLSNANVNSNGAETNTTYYPDALHGSAATYALIGSLRAASLNAWASNVPAVESTGGGGTGVRDMGNPQKLFDDAIPYTANDDNFVTDTVAMPYQLGFYVVTGGDVSIITARGNARTITLQDGEAYYGRVQKIKATSTTASGIWLMAYPV